MTAADAPPPRPVVARPIDDEHERPYVWTTVTASMATLHGGAGGLYADRRTIARLADAILCRSTIQVVTFERDPMILGFACWTTMVTRDIEFLYLRQCVVPRRAWDETEWGLGRLSDAPHTDDELRVSDRAVAALLGEERRFTARRPLHPRVLEAVVHAGYTPMVVPRAI